MDVLYVMKGNDLQRTEEIHKSLVSLLALGGPHYVASRMFGCNKECSKSCENTFQFRIKIKYDAE